MTVWDLLTWGAVAVLGPGALVVFVAFVRGLVTHGGLRAPPKPPNAPGPK